MLRALACWDAFHEMTLASCVGARVRLGDVPLIEGTRELLELDEAPGGTYANLAALDSAEAVVWEADMSQNDRLVLCDAQTAGGLLLSVAPERVEAMREALSAANTLAAEIGEIVTDSECRVYVEA